MGLLQGFQGRCLLSEATFFLGLEKDEESTSWIGIWSKFHYITSIGESQTGLQS